MPDVMPVSRLMTDTLIHSRALDAIAVCMAIIAIELLFGLVFVVYFYGSADKEL